MKTNSANGSGPKVHKTILIVLYLMGAIFAITVAVHGYDYYTLPLQERPHSSLHPNMKPSGVLGHGVGILGSAMLLLLFLYSARKRNKFGLRFGKIGQWLNIHIFLGIMGPILVTLHTSFKFGGIVSVSYFSMLAVMLSGFVGRYLYVQIPRSLSGDELSMKEIQEESDFMKNTLIEKYHVDPRFLDFVQDLSGVRPGQELQGLGAFTTILKNDFSRPSIIRSLKKQLANRKPKIPAGTMNGLIKLVKEQALLTRKMALLSAIQPLFHYWHVIHKPFAHVMVIIMFLHIAVTLLFGSRWIF